MALLGEVVGNEVVQPLEVLQGLPAKELSESRLKASDRLKRTFGRLSCMFHLLIINKRVGVSIYTKERKDHARYDSNLQKLWRWL